MGRPEPPPPRPLPTTPARLTERELEELGDDEAGLDLPSYEQSTDDLKEDVAGAEGDGSQDENVQGRFGRWGAWGMASSAALR